MSASIRDIERHHDGVSVQSTNQNRASIFDCPLFLREQIYGYIFHDTIIHINLHPLRRNVHPLAEKDHFYGTHMNTDRPCRTLAIAQTCPELRAEALAQCYKMAVFRLETGLPYISRMMTALVDKVSRTAKREDERGESTMAVPQDGENEIDVELDTHLTTVIDLFTKLRRVEIGCELLPHIGWDPRSMIWTRSAYDMFPQIKELGIISTFYTCGFEDLPLANRFDPDTGNFWGWDGQKLNDGPYVSDGEFLLTLFRSTPHPIDLKFWLDFVENCCEYGHISLVFCPNRNPRVELRNWEAYHRCIDDMLRILDEYGLHDEAIDVQKILRDGEASQAQV